MTKIVLSKRLRAIADMVTPGYRLADVGTDHGFLPIVLTLEERIPSAIAMDLREGPLSRARDHIEERALSDRIQVRLSDGVEKLKPCEADALTVAGMGGMLIAKILTAHLQITCSMKELVLGPQSELAGLRRTITEELGFVIDRECMICEDGKYYPIIHAVPLDRYLAEQTASGAQMKAPARLSDMELAFGPKLLEQRDPVLKEYLLWKKGVTESIEEKLSHTASETAADRHHQVKEELRLLCAALNVYEV